MLGIDSSREKIIILEEIEAAQTTFEKATKDEGQPDWYTCHIRPKTKKELQWQKKNALHQKYCSFIVIQTCIVSRENLSWKYT